MVESILSWLVPLIVAGLVGAVGWIVRLAIQLNSIVKDIESGKKDTDLLRKDYEFHKAHNAGQHEELYTSRNQTDQTLVLLKTLFENMDKKLDQLLDRRSGPRS